MSGTKKKVAQKSQKSEISEKPDQVQQESIEVGQVVPVQAEEVPVVPTLVESQEQTPMDKEIAKMQAKMLKLVNDSIDVLDCAINGNEWRNTGKKVSRTQLYAAAPLVGRFAPELATIKSGAVHLHLSIPRPKQAQGEGAKPTQVIEAQAKDVPNK